MSKVCFFFTYFPWYKYLGLNFPVVSITYIPISSAIKPLSSISFISVIYCCSERVKLRFFFLFADFEDLTYFLFFINIIFASVNHSNVFQRSTLKINITIRLFCLPITFMEHLHVFEWHSRPL